MTITKNIIILLFVFSLTVSCGKNKGNNDDAFANSDFNDSKNETFKETDSTYKSYTLNYKLGETPVSLDVIDISSNHSIKMFNLHENEPTSYEAGKKTLKLYGGRLVKIKSKGNRNIVFKISGKNYTIDPNRIFTEMGLERTLNNLGNSSPEAIKTVSDFVNDILDSLFNGSSQAIIALHNNSPGSYSLSSYMKGGEEENNAVEVHKSKEYSMDDFFVVTRKDIFDSLRAYNFNVVLQNNENPYDDGSLSVYCGKNNINYINVEAQPSHLKEQTFMLEILYRILIPSFIKSN